VHRHAERAARQVPQRHLHGGAGERIALDPARHLAAQWLDAGRVAAHQPWRDVALDHGLHGLRGFLAPRRSAEAGGLAPAHEPVARLDAHERKVDDLERRERHRVRPLDRDVGEDHADVGNCIGALCLRETWVA